MIDYWQLLHESIINHRLNMLYLIVSICVIYKLAWICRQASMGRSYSALAVRLSAGLVGTVILVRAMMRFDGDDPARWVDILRELSWCAFLFAAICLLRSKLGHW